MKKNESKKVKEYPLVKKVRKKAAANTNLSLIALQSLLLPKKSSSGTDSSAQNQPSLEN